MCYKLYELYKLGIEIGVFLLNEYEDFINCVDSKKTFWNIDTLTIKF